MKDKTVMKKTLQILTMSLAFFTVQACSSPKPEQADRSPNSDSIMPKEFGDRFSIDHIKNEREQFYAQKRMELKRTSPIEQVNIALRKNAPYLMKIPGGRGGSPTFPGLVEPKVLQVKCNTQTVQGMGDVLYGKNHSLYRKELLLFMKEFNALMSPHCK